MKQWFEITPQEALDQTLDLSVNLDITAPLNENGDRCPWPWEPQQLVGAPLGQYHCSYCGAMVLAGMPHGDYSGIDEMYEQYCKDYENDPPPSDADMAMPEVWHSKYDEPFEAPTS